MIRWQIPFELWAMFVLGSREKFLTLHFNKLPKFHSDMIFLHLYFKNTFQCRSYLPLTFAFFSQSLFANSS